ncbi:MAG TPA: hypothetical protein PK668_23750 [Myxococcota bacterium]|nr:hypothetical protein [Myxococcota bacterium]HRY96434.1 hypothetical protein [Myxococcota bacterium]HSA24779.1 hypothetical protein [Myxococcota bacterium]
MRARYATSLAITGIIALLAQSPPARAKAWKGMEPGKTTKEQVIDKFGAPTKAFTQGGELSDGLSFQGDQAIAGTTEANFFFDKAEVLFRIDVYPEREVSAAQVRKIYGPDCEQKRLAGGLSVLVYPKAGLSVFFNPDGKAHIFQFTPEPKAKPADASAWE